MLVDSREQDRIAYAQKRCRAWNWDCEVKELQIGDYICGNTVFEYKTVIDFIASMYDGRLKREAINQANNYPYHFVLIVGDIAMGVKQYQFWLKNSEVARKSHYGDVCNFHETQVLSAIASLCTYTTPLMVITQKDAFNLMKRVMEKCNDTNKTLVIPVEKMSRNPCFNFIRGIPRISDKRANAIVDGLELTSLRDLIRCEREDFLSIRGIGDSLADEIMKAINGEDKRDSYER